MLLTLISLKVRLKLFISFSELKPGVNWCFIFSLNIVFDLCVPQFDNPLFCTFKFDPLVEPHLHVALAVQIFQLNTPILIRENCTFLAKAFRLSL